MIANHELIEKAARALHGARTRWFRWERLGEPRRRRLRKQAVAVLRALGYVIEEATQQRARVPAVGRVTSQEGNPRPRAPRPRLL